MHPVPVCPERKSKMENRNGEVNKFALVDSSPTLGKEHFEKAIIQDTLERWRKRKKRNGVRMEG